jgi:hypothetical protein
MKKIAKENGWRYKEVKNNLRLPGRTCRNMNPAVRRKTDALVTDVTSWKCTSD